MAERIKITNNRIVNGIIFFGIAHIIYVFGFLAISGFKLYLWNTIVYILLVIIIYIRICYNATISTVINVFSFLYSMILGFLVIQILTMCLNSEYDIYFRSFSLVGIILFAISDGAIAYSNFRDQFKFSEIIIAITYIMAQILLQSSILFI